MLGEKSERNAPMTQQSYANFQIYRSPLDMLHDYYPWRSIPEPVAIALLLYVGIAGFAFAGGEVATLITDFTTPVVIIGIGSMIFLEKRIGDYVRSTASEILAVAHYDSTPSMKLIFSRKIRFGVGLLSATSCGIAFAAIPILDVLWYQAPITRAYLAGLALFLAFIAGEAIFGAIALTHASRTITNGLTDIIEPLNFEHFRVLKKIAMWGVLLSLFGSLVVSVLLVGIAVAPWRTSPLNVQITTLGMFVTSSGFIIYLYVTPLMLTHGVLKSSKQKILFQISSSLEKIYTRFGHITDGNDVGKTQAEADLIGKILTDAQIARAIAASTPEWPWDLPMMHAFTISLVLPLIIYYLEKLLSPTPILK